MKIVAKSKAEEMNQRTRQNKIDRILEPIYVILILAFMISIPVLLTFYFGKTGSLLGVGIVFWFIWFGNWYNNGCCGGCCGVSGWASTRRGLDLLAQNFCFAAVILTKQYPPFTQLLIEQLPLSYSQLETAASVAIDVGVAFLIFNIFTYVISFRTCCG